MLLVMCRIAISRLNPIMMTHRNDLRGLDMKAAMEIRIVIPVMDRAYVRPVTEKDGIDPRLEITVNVRIANTVSPEYATLAMAGEKYMA